RQSTWSLSAGAANRRGPSATHGARSRGDGSPSPVVGPRLGERTAQARLPVRASTATTAPAWEQYTTLDPASVSRWWRGRGAGASSYSGLSQTSWRQRGAPVSAL